MQKLASYLDYKMVVEVNCALITVSSGGLFKAMLLKYYSNKNLPANLPILPNIHSQLIPHILMISFAFASNLNLHIISGSYTAFQQQNHAPDVCNCVINEILISLKP